MAKSMLNPLTDTPTSLTQLTQSFMLQYMRAKGSDEEKAWFKELCNANALQRTNNLNGKPTQVLSLQPVRRAFAEKYFPQLLKKKQGKTFFDELNEL